MAIKTDQHIVEGFMSNLLFHQDPDTRLDAALQLGERANRIAAQRLALEALTQALHDPDSTVQEAVLQSLMRMSVSNA